MCVCGCPRSVGKPRESTLIVRPGDEQHVRVKTVVCGTMKPGVEEFALSSKVN